MSIYWYDKKILRSFIAKILFHITARIFHQLKCPMCFKIRIFDQVIQFGYEIFVRRGYGIQIINSKNISFLNWKQEMQIVFALFLIQNMFQKVDYCISNVIVINDICTNNKVMFFILLKVGRSQIQFFLPSILLKNMQKNILFLLKPKKRVK